MRSDPMENFTGAPEQLSSTRASVRLSAGPAAVTASLQVVAALAGRASSSRSVDTSPVQVGPRAAPDCRLRSWPADRGEEAAGEGRGEHPALVLPTNQPSLHCDGAVVVVASIRPALRRPTRARRAQPRRSSDLNLNMAQSQSSPLFDAIAWRVCMSCMRVWGRASNCPQQEK